MITGRPTTRSLALAGLLATTTLLPGGASAQGDAAANAALAEPWRALWNGDMGQLDAIVAEDVVVHAALTGGGEGMTGREALGQWIGGMHAAIEDLDFAVEVGPIADADHVVVRWRATGTYRGGMPGVPDGSAGRPIDVTGTDVLRVEDGLLAEYWVNSDTLLLMQQLGVGG